MLGATPTCPVLGADCTHCIAAAAIALGIRPLLYLRERKHASSCHCSSYLSRHQSHSKGATVCPFVTVWPLPKKPHHPPRLAHTVTPGAQCISDEQPSDCRTLSCDMLQGTRQPTWGRPHLLQPPKQQQPHSLSGLQLPGIIAPVQRVQQL